MMSGLDGIFCFPSPWQEFADPIGRVTIGHASQDIGEPGIGFDAIELRRFDQRAEESPAFSTAIAAGEQVVLAAEGNRSDRSFNRVGVEFDAAVIEEPGEACPAPERISDSICERASGGQLGQLAFEPEAEVFNARSGQFPACGQPPVRGFSADIRLDGVEVGDALERLFSNGRTGGLGDVVELPPRVRPASCEGHTGPCGDLVKPGISIDMEHAFEVLEVGDGTFGLAVRCEQEDGGWRLRTAPSALIAGIDPEPPRLRPSSPRIEHRDRCVVGEQMVRSEHICAKFFMQGFEPPAGAADPSGKRGTGQIDAMPREDLRLPVERRVIAILADKHLCEQRRCRKSACNDALRRHLVENYFCKIKEFKRIAFRSDKTDASYQSMIYAAATIIELR